MNRCVAMRYEGNQFTLLKKITDVSFVKKQNIRIYYDL